MAINILGLAEIAARTGKKMLPNLLIGVGITGLIGSTIWGTTKAIKKAPKIKEEYKEAMNDIIDAAECDEIDETTAKQQVGIIALKTVGNYCKEFAAPVALCAISIYSIIKGHNITVKENKVLAAAYTALGSAYTYYRNNVKERYGKEVDYELANGIKRETIEKVIVDKKGNEKVVKEEVLVKTDKVGSPYSFFWGEDAGCRYYTGDPLVDKEFLMNEEDYFNNIIHIRASKSPFGIGIVTLNEVLKHLELPEQIFGFRAGWIYRVNNPFPNSDNYISFGIFNPVNARFVDGLENKNVLLDFNCDGDVEKMYEDYIGLQNS